MFEKRKIIEKVANISVGLDEHELSELSVEKTFVHFPIQAARWANEGEVLPVLDHRPEVIQTAREMLQKKVSSKDWRKSKEALSKAITQPAKVVVMKVMNKILNEKVGECVGLFPPGDQKPTALFFKRKFASKCDSLTDYELEIVGYEIHKDNSYWSFKSESFSRTGVHWELVLIGLTDDEHRIEVESWDDTTSDPLEEWNITVIGSECRQMSWEEWEEEWEKQHGPLP